MTKEDLCNTVPKEVLELQKDFEQKKQGFFTKRRVNTLTFIITMIAASVVCTQSARRYFSWMAQTVIDRTDVHISEIPFPAVTLCPLMSVHELKKDPYIKDDPIVIEFLRTLEKMVPDSDELADFNDQGLTALEYIDEDDLFKNITFKCEDFLAECTWRRIKRNCCTLFRRARYGKRMCYAFNSLAVEDPEPTWPWSENLYGRKSGLRVLMKTNASDAMMQKVMAMIHYPEEQISSNRLYLEGEVHITVDALKFYADSDIRQLHPDYRRCFFTDEKIKLGKSTNKCLKACRISYIERSCKCTPRGLLLKSKGKKVYCNSTHLPCIYEHKSVFFSSGYIYEKRVDEDTVEVMDCKCFPNCNYVQYKTFVRYDMETYNKIENNSLTDLQVYYLRDTIFSYRTAMVYSLLDLTVAISSIIALFLGVSVISVIKSIQNHLEQRKKARALGKAQQHK